MVEWLILHTVESAALTAVVLLICFRLRPAPATRHALWLLVLVKLLTPPLVRWPWPLPVPAVSQPAPVACAVAPVRIADEPPAPAVVLPAAAPPVLIDAPSPPVEAPVAIDPPLDLEPPASAAETAPDPGTPLSTWLLRTAMGIWIVGGFVVALVQLVRIVRLHRRLRHGLPAPDSLVALVRETAKLLRIKPPRVAVLPDAASPMVWGAGAPCLLWPQGLEQRLSDEGRRAVVLHELVHLRRRDHWVGWLLLAGGCVWWWHPLFAFVRRRLSLEAELACDARVVEALPEARRAYAEALLEVSQRPSPLTAPALGAAAGRRDLERRLIMIMRGSGMGGLSWRALLGVGVLGLLALPAWSLGQGEAPKPTPAAQPPATIDNPNPPPAALPAPVVKPAAAEKVPVTYYEPITTYRAVTTYREARPETTPAAAPPQTDRDKKLQDLEAKIKVLLKELEDLRTEPGQPPAKEPPTKPMADILYLNRLFAVQRLAEPVPPMAVPLATPPNAGEVTLSRVTYKLPAGKAEPIAAFLRDQIKASVLETKADGDSLIVTTTPETQHVIGQFIGLIQGKTPASPPALNFGPGTAPVPAPPATPPLDNKPELLRRE